MKVQKIIFTIIASASLITVASISISHSIVQAQAADALSDGRDGKVTQSSTRPLPIRLPANKDLPIAVFRTRESLTKSLAPGSVLEKFEMIAYQEYLKKYTTNTLGATDVSPDRMVAVMIVNFPRGLVGDHAEYSSARVVAALDALTGQTISYELTGKSIKSSGAGYIEEPISK